MYQIQNTFCTLIWQPVCVFTHFSFCACITISTIIFVRFSHTIYYTFQFQYNLDSYNVLRFYAKYSRNDSVDFTVLKKYNFLVRLMSKMVPSATFNTDFSWLQLTEAPFSVAAWTENIICLEDGMHKAFLNVIARKFPQLSLTFTIASPLVARTLLLRLPSASSI